MLKQSDYEKIKQELDYCKKPIYFFHDDADGLASFLLAYRYKGEGKGVVIKTTPNIDMKFARKVEEYDKVFILDIAGVEQDFIDAVKVPVVWIDHHGPYKRQRVKYYNPRNNGSHPPVSYIMSKVIGEDDWIAMAGCVGDWYLPPDYKEFSKKYPKLLPAKIKRPQDALFKTKIGQMAEVFNFILKGSAEDAMKYVKVLTRIETPEDILKQETNKGKFIWKKYVHVKKLYNDILKKANKAGKSKILLYMYSENNMSFTGELSNELLYFYPDKIIIIAREKSGEMKCSLRSSKIILPPILEKCLAGLNGRGGGHEHACGAVIDVKDFDEFLIRFEKEIKDN